ncbi:MAG: hypothetical protein IJE54_04390, partial [Peptococcaceae bacterium]|nr:hypothetical protein [Peptococcaceae bacterium]
MPPETIEPLRIGIIGHPALLRCNILQLRKFPVSILPVYHPMQIAQVDGLLITGWHYPSLYRNLYP